MNRRSELIVAGAGLALCALLGALIGQNGLAAISAAISLALLTASLFAKPES